MATGSKPVGILTEEMSDHEQQILLSILSYFLYIILIHCLMEVLNSNAVGWILSLANVVLKTLYNPLTQFQP